MTKYSLTDFLPIVKENYLPIIFSQGQFNNLNEILYIRPKIENTKPFLMSCQHGIISCLSFDGFEYNIPKMIKNQLLEKFQDHQFILNDSFLEILIGPLNTFILNDIFLDTNEIIEPTRKRFTKLLKLFRESKTCSEYSFNLPQLVSSVEYLNQKLETFNIFYMNEPTKIIEII